MMKMLTVIMCVAVMGIVTGCDQLNTSKDKEVVEMPVKHLVRPCFYNPEFQLGDKHIRNGFHHVEVKDIVNAPGKDIFVLTHCVPCEKAKTADEKFACEAGEKGTE